MPTTNQINVSSGDNLLLVGTIKGAFLFRSGGAREKWEKAVRIFPAEASTPWPMMDATDAIDFGRRSTVHSGDRF